MADFLNLEGPQLDGLKRLADRSHDGSVTVREIIAGDLPWLEVSVLLPDMGDRSPLHTFLLSPKGVVKDPGYVQGAAFPSSDLPKEA